MRIRRFTHTNIPRSFQFVSRHVARASLLLQMRFDSVIRRIQVTFISVDKIVTSIIIIYRSAIVCKKRRAEASAVWMHKKPFRIFSCGTDKVATRFCTFINSFPFASFLQLSTVGICICWSGRAYAIIHVIFGVAFSISIKSRVMSYPFVRGIGNVFSRRRPAIF